MTEAYIEGFAKMAEECGVDPQALMKSAGIPSGYLAANIGKTIMRATPRSLFGGDRIRHLKSIAANPATSAHGPARDLLAKALNATNMVRANELERAMKFLKGAYPNGIPQSILTKLNALGTGIDSRSNRLTAFLPQRVGGNPGVSSVRQEIDNFLS